MKKTAKVHAVDQLAEDPDKLADTLDAAERIILDELIARGMPTDGILMRERLRAWAFDNIDFDADFLEQAHIVLGLVRSIRERNPSEDVMVLVSDGISLGLKLRALLQQGEKSDEPLTDALREFYFDKRRQGFGDPTHGQAAQWVRAKRGELYEEKSQKNPKYWQASFKTRWYGKLLPKFRADWESQHKSR